MEWIPINHQLPVYWKHILLLTEEGEISTGYLTNCDWHIHLSGGTPDSRVTHWMELPKRPKKISQKH